MQYHPHDAFDKFEDISILVKQTNFNVSDPCYDFEMNSKIANSYGKVTTSHAI